MKGTKLMPRKNNLNVYSSLMLSLRNLANHRHYNTLKKKRCSLPKTL